MNELSLNDDAKSVAESAAFLSGGGEMGRLMRAFDWASTHLGPPEGWPQSLKVAVSICLGSRHPIVLWWGRSTLAQFYNSAHIASLGPGKHPSALGRSARECWSEIWLIIGPMIERVFETGEATWSEDLLLVLDRVLPREEAYFTFSFSPIRNDDGTVGGIFCAGHETTRRVIGERRLKTLRDLRPMSVEATAEGASEAAARALEANPADIPFSLIYLRDGDNRTARLAATTHLRPGEAASPSRIDLEDQTAAAARWPLREVLDSGQTLFMPELEETVGVIRGGRWPESIPAAMIMPIPGPTGPAGWLVSGISPRLSPDADYREFLEFAAANIGASMTNARAYEEERKRAEALARLAAIVESSDDAIVSKDLDGIIQSWNGGAERLFGYTAEEAIGRSITIIIPEERSGEEPDILARLRLGERIDHFETVRRRKDGELLDVSLTISPVRDRHGHIVGASKIARDITKRKRAEGIQSEQQALLEAIAAGKPLEQCLRQVTAAVHRLQPFARAGVLLADPSGRKVERCFTSDIPSSFGEGVCGLPISEAFIGSSGTAMFRGEPVMCPDIANDDRWSREWRDLCAMHEVAAIRSTPIFGSEGTAIGSLFICFATPHHPDGWDLRVAEVGAHVAAIAIQRDQARQAVALRTAQFESLFSAAPVGLCLVDAALRIREVNPVAVPIFAKVPDPVGRDFEDVMRATWPGEAAAEIIGQFHKTLRSGEAYGPAGPALRWREADQAEYYEWRLDRLLLPDGQYGIVCYFRDISMQVAAGKAIVESEARLRHIIDSAHEYAITSVDGEGRIRSWNAGAERLLGYDESEALGQSGQIFFTPEDVAAGVLEQEITIAREAGRAASERWHVRKDGSRFWGSGVMLPLLSGEPDMFLKIFRDRTERRQADRRQQMLIHELNHRVKNTLATIQAIVRQTFRGEHSGKEAEAALEARLMTLARCHDLLAREHWEGADLGELARGALEPFAAAGGLAERFSIEGERVRLSSQAAQSLAMGIHELAANAVKYGSLSVPGGKVSVHWKIEAWKGEDLVRFTWEERNGPPVSAPARKGYGSRLIERALAFEMGGSAKLDYRKSGLRCEVRMPSRTPIAPG